MRACFAWLSAGRTVNEQLRVESDDDEDVKKDFAVASSFHRSKSMFEGYVGRSIHKNGKTFSRIGSAVLSELYKKHQPARLLGAWGKTSGKVSQLVMTPPSSHFGAADGILPDGHSDHLPLTMSKIVASANRWVDITSLSPPDGDFQKHLRDALTELAHKSARNKHKVIVRIMFGNIVGMAVNTDAVLESLVMDARNVHGSRLKVWVGSYRKSMVSWNHSKIIAVDGIRLFQGGHNLWDGHYLRANPVHDVSMELSGPVAIDGHYFANRLWKFVNLVNQYFLFLTLIPKWVPCTPFTLDARVMVSCYPSDLGMAPKFTKLGMWRHRLCKQVPAPERFCPTDASPIISIGRLGNLAPRIGNPSDEAFNVMLCAAKKSIMISQQDLGPFAAPTPFGPKALPGTQWPDSYLDAIAKCLLRGVIVQIVLSNPYSVPGDVSKLAANYGNGWRTVDVAAKIMEHVTHQANEKETLSIASIGCVLQRTLCNLHVAYISRTHSDNQGTTELRIGNHAKFFMVDNRCFYLGSQNMYVANLAEWGLIVDDRCVAAEVLREYWAPMWQQASKNACGRDKILECMGRCRELDNCDMCLEERSKSMILNCGTQPDLLHLDGDEKSVYVAELEKDAEYRKRQLVKKVASRFKSLRHVAH
eukprot:TRINITY_DN17870_c0_g1_i1.p1 TRINITY_DN17870_c0_g1~~TRINITY_DN17870_c0_g1_i1.p1  ORF type:complete len:645 (-),score=53.57 TRINITY_DN17870_c0_g1_i1:132-2066(-)